MSNTISSNQENFESASAAPEELKERGTFISLSDDIIDTIVDAIGDKDHQKIKDYLINMGGKDTAELLSKISLSNRYILVEQHIDDIHPETFVEMDDDLRTVTLELLKDAEVAQLLSKLETDDAVDVIVQLDPLFQKQILKRMSSKDRLVLEEGLTYEEDSAGRLMERRFVAIPQFWTVGKTIDYLRIADEDLPDDFFDIFVIDPLYRIVGEIPLNKIIRSRRSENIENLMSDATHPIPATMDQEDVAMIFRREGLVSAPVVDDMNRLIGVISIDDIVAVIDEEAQEDILRLGGVESTDIYRDVLTTTKSRFSWLFLNLLTAISASVVIGLFDATIDEIVALAILMPIVASMGGNAGTQTLTVAVRALATKDISRSNMWRLINKETLVGLLNGLAFACIIGGVTYLWFNDAILGSIISAAMVINMIVAGLFGISIPIILDKLEIDPALASSVFLTTVTDVIGFFSFLGLASIFLV
jgi:magnesium transporter